jgi:uncharacterized damage-inducible protein DinB
MMNERTAFLSRWENEFKTTLKVLKAYPTAKSTLRPHAKCPTAHELAFRIAMEEPLFVNGALTGVFDFMNPPAMPPTLEAVIASYEQTHAGLVEKIRACTDADYEKKIKFFVAPKTMGDIRSADALWIMLNDSIHHRGQFSIYLRMADGKVPSIYGPSGDEPWM